MTEGNFPHLKVEWLNLHLVKLMNNKENNLRWFPEEKYILNVETKEIMLLTSRQKKI